MRATFVRRNAVELLQASTMAIVGQMTFEQIWLVTMPFPNSERGIKNLVEGCRDVIW